MRDVDLSITQKNLHINLLTEQNQRLQQALDYETARIAHDEAWYRDPKLTVPAAFVLGFIAAIYAGKH